MLTPANQESRPTSLFHEPQKTFSAHTLDLKVPQWKACDAEYLLGLNDILDDISPTSDHGPLSGIGLHRLV